MKAKTYVLDVAERTGSTFGEAFLAYLGSNASGMTHYAIWKGAAAAGIAAVLAVGKGLLAGQVGQKGTASLLPAPPTVTAPATQGPAADASTPGATESTSGV